MRRIPSGKATPDLSPRAHLYSPNPLVADHEEAQIYIDHLGKGKLLNPTTHQALLLTLLHASGKRGCNILRYFNFFERAHDHLCCKVGITPPIAVRTASSCPANLPDDCEGSKFR